MVNNLQSTHAASSAASIVFVCFMGPKRLVWGLDKQGSFWNGGSLNCSVAFLVPLCLVVRNPLNMEFTARRVPKSPRGQLGTRKAKVANQRAQKTGFCMGKVLVVRTTLRTGFGWQNCVTEITRPSMFTPMVSECYLKPHQIWRSCLLLGFVSCKTNQASNQRKYVRCGSFCGQAFHNHTAGSPFSRFAAGRCRSKTCSYWVAASIPPTMVSINQVEALYIVDICLLF